MRYYLDFEKPIEEFETKIDELKRLSDGSDIDITSEIKKLDKKIKDLRTEIFSNLSPWQKTLIARHPDRPYTLDYLSLLTNDFVELHGDRRFADDPAIVGGLGTIGGATFMIIGHQKGRGTKERIYRNFGQPNPEGYRKALRLMKLAERFKLPILTFIDTPGAYPGIGAEERGQAEAIARSTEACLTLGSPFIATIIGEGGSGGAVAIATANKVFMLEHSIYSVISPEGCASILWHKSEKAADAASAMRITAQDLIDLNIIDAIIPEPIGGAHRAPEKAIDAAGDAIERALRELSALNPDELRRQRREKFLKIGIA
jgi:acetyl-CoA carboxylase carboxyl transferase subunit alpha